MSDWKTRFRQKFWHLDGYILNGRNTNEEKQDTRSELERLEEFIESELRKAKEEVKIDWSKLLIEKSVLLALSECNVIVTKNKLENIIKKVKDSLK